VSLPGLLLNARDAGIVRPSTAELKCEMFEAQRDGRIRELMGVKTAKGAIISPDKSAGRARARLAW